MSEHTFKKLPELNLSKTEMLDIVSLFGSEMAALLVYLHMMKVSSVLWYDMTRFSDI